MAWSSMTDHVASNIAKFGKSRLSVIGLIVIGGFCSANLAKAKTTAGDPQPKLVSHESVGSKTRVPDGWIDFCNRRPGECAQLPRSPIDFKLTVASLRELNHVNRFVNAKIVPVSNLEHWGTMVDHWDYPTDGKGDCKIYALYKRKLLLQRGYPRQALLMTIVHDLNGEGHTILTVKTDHGDFILDNLTDKIVGWDETGYRFVKRQSQEDPNIWVGLNN
jgi:predicted transglutaminase-like cysteine proteinase